MRTLLLRISVALLVGTAALSFLPATAARRTPAPRRARIHVTPTESLTSIELTTVSSSSVVETDNSVPAPPTPSVILTPADSPASTDSSPAPEVTHASSFYADLARKASALGSSSVSLASAGPTDPAPARPDAPPAAPGSATDAHPPRPPRVPRVAVIGGGVTGAATAFYLRQYFQPPAQPAAAAGVIATATNYAADAEPNTETAHALNSRVHIDVYERGNTAGGQARAFFSGSEQQADAGASAVVFTPFLSDVASDLSLCADTGTLAARSEAARRLAAERHAQEAVDVAVVAPALSLLRPRSLMPSTAPAQASETSVLRGLCLLRGAVRARRAAAAALARAHAELSAPLASFMGNAAHLAPLHTAAGVVHNVMGLPSYDDTPAAEPHSAAHEGKKARAESVSLEADEACPCAAARSVPAAPPSAAEATLVAAFSGAPSGVYFSALGTTASLSRGLALLDAPVEHMWRIASRVLSPRVCSDPAFKLLDSDSAAVTPRLDLLGMVPGLPRALAVVVSQPGIERTWIMAQLTSAGRAPRPARAHGYTVPAAAHAASAWSAEAVALFARVAHALAQPADKESARVYLFESCVDAALLVPPGPELFTAAAARVLGCSTSTPPVRGRAKEGPSDTGALPLPDALLAHAGCGVGDLGPPSDALPALAQPCLADMSRLVPSLLKQSGAVLLPNTAVSRVDLAPTVGNLKPLYTLVLESENISASENATDIAAAVESVLYDYVVLAAPLGRTDAAGNGAVAVDARILRADRAFQFYHTSLAHTAAAPRPAERAQTQLQVITAVGVPGPLAFSDSALQTCVKTAAAAGRLSAFAQRSGHGALVVAAARVHALLATALALGANGTDAAALARVVAPAATVAPLAATVSLLDALQSVAHSAPSQLPASAALAIKPWARSVSAVATAFAEEFAAQTREPPARASESSPCSAADEGSEACVLRQHLSLRHRLALQAVRLPIAAVRYTRVLGGAATPAPPQHCFSAVLARPHAASDDAAVAAVLAYAAPGAAPPTVRTYAVSTEPDTLYYRPYSYFSPEQAQTAADTGSPMLSALSHAHAPTSTAAVAAAAAVSPSPVAAPPPLRLYGHNLYYPSALTAGNALTLPPSLETSLLAARAAALLVAEDLAHPRRSAAEHFAALANERQFARARLPRREAAARDAAGAVAARLHGRLAGLVEEGVTMRRDNVFAPPLEAVAGAIRGALFPQAETGREPERSAAPDASKEQQAEEEGSVRRGTRKRKQRRRSGRERGHRKQPRRSERTMAGRAVRTVPGPAPAGLDPSATPAVSAPRTAFVAVCPLPTVELDGCSRLGDYWGTDVAADAAMPLAVAAADGRNSGAAAGTGDSPLPPPESRRGARTRRERRRGRGTGPQQSDEALKAKMQAEDAATARRAGWQPSRRPARNALHELDHTATNASMRRREARVRQDVRARVLLPPAEGAASEEGGQVAD